MPKPSQSLYAYLAFNQSTGTMLAHGRTAAHAMLKADQAAPNDPIIALRAGSAGILMWSTKVPLSRLENFYFYQSRLLNP